ncbi:hypothetical protein L211DRAFT_851889 [Terfezia boudieri ATCC MYA-4762]|uniref:Uncharacterized protein n=1 Tax=Terfezia boudieri ATCC MYA-4762 TaxID=1051890 RepID=A0A3N4LSP0_9PEZI|nr:hypothetical protein L211DRAFT_851889 [Terfezia boudieri ATCC MYA-4762]
MVTAVASELKLLGEDISDQKIKWQLLGNLLPEYSPLVTTLSNMDTEQSPLDIQTVKKSIIREEKSISINTERKKEIMKIPSTSIPIHSATKASNEVCTNCGKPMYFQENYWYKYLEKASGWWKKIGESASKEKEKKSKKKEHKKEVKRKQKYKKRQDSNSEEFSLENYDSDSNQENRQVKKRSKQNSKAKTNEVKAMIGTFCIPRHALSTHYMCMMYGKEKPKDDTNRLPSTYHIS